MLGRTHSREFKLDLMTQVNGGQKTTAQLCREHSLLRPFRSRPSRRFYPVSVRLLTFCGYRAPVFLPEAGQISGQGIPKERCRSKN